MEELIYLAMPFGNAPAQNVSDVEFLRTGTFTDMNGNAVEVSEGLLAQLAANFAANTAQQEIPVDVMHRRAEAAGWVTAIGLEGDRGIATVQWNSLGLQLVQDRVYRYLSASIERENAVLRSISLTNFPAVKGLAPVELSEYVLSGSPDVVSDGGPMSEQENVVASTLASPSPAVVPLAVVSPPVPQPTVSAPYVVAQASAPRVVASAPQVAAPAPQVVASAPQIVASPSQVSLEMLSEAARESLMAEMAQRFEAGKDKMFGELMEQWRTERTILQFAERVTAGSQRALPVKQADLVSLLKEMPAPLRDKTMALLQHIFTQGLVDLTEHGTSLAGGTPKALPADMKTALQAWVTAGHKLDVFFEANDLGAMGQYDLTEFTK